MEILIIPRPGDRERLQQNLLNLSGMSSQELVDAYNNNVSIGITGTQAQGLYLLAMHKTFLNRFGTSPIAWTDNIVLSLGKEVDLVDGGWRMRSSS